MLSRLESEVAAPALDALRKTLSTSADARFQHRLHCVLLVAAGLGCGEVARLFGDDARTVQRWVEKYRRDGVDGLGEGVPSGRPRVLDGRQTAELVEVLRSAPAAHGPAATAGRGQMLRDEIKRRFGVTLSTRHCQRLVRELVTSDANGAAEESTDTSHGH